MQDSQHAPTDTCLHVCHGTDPHERGVDTSPCLAIEDSEVRQSSKTHAVKPLLRRQETLQRIIIFDTLSDVGVHGPCEDHEAMAVHVGEREVYRSAKRLLKPQESCTHTFSVINLPPTYSVNLKESHVCCSTQKGPGIPRHHKFLSNMLALFLAFSRVVTEAHTLRRHERSSRLYSACLSSFQQTSEPQRKQPCVQLPRQTYFVRPSLSASGWNSFFRAWLGSRYSRPSHDDIE